ncbi:COG1741 Pirin-related protein [Methylophilaceae bacterium]
MQIRPSNERGHFNHGWLDSYHSFSFGRYVDKNWMGFSALRVINEDVIQPGQGFGMHSHDNIEIITYILKGELAHKDNIGNVKTIKRGYIQLMTAATGVSHSEFNASATEPVHLLQIWILPNQLNLTPGYEDKFFNPALKLNQWCLLASQTGTQDSLIVHQDIALYVSQLTDTHELTYHTRLNRKAYLQMALGSAVVNNKPLQRGDAALFDADEAIQIKALGFAEVLLFDLP